MRGDGLLVKAQALHGMRSGIGLLNGLMIFGIERNGVPPFRDVFVVRRCYAVSSRSSSVYARSSWCASSVRSSSSLQAQGLAYRLSDVKCKKPFRKGLIEAGCRRCLPCRINEQRLWTIRGVLEAGQHLHSSFVTLTKDDEHLGDGSVSVREAQLFLKNLRYSCGPFRYLLCGEYGEHTWRPHYHAILFGVRDGYGVAAAWKKGHIHISGVGPESIAYVSGYCLKGAHTTRGMRWHGKSLSPEFRLQSRRPGLGAVAADRIGDFYSSKIGAGVLQRAGNVSPVVRFTKGMWPLGRYLVSRVKDGAGLNQDLLSEISARQRLLQLQSFDQSSLNDYIELITGRSEQSGFRAEEKYKRIALEKKL